MVGMFLAGLGEWIEGNPAVFGAFLLQVIFFAIWLASIQWGMRENRGDISHMKDEIEKLKEHASDPNKHVNHLFMGTIKDRIDKLESEVKQGHKELADQIDRKFATLTQLIK